MGFEDDPMQKLFRLEGHPLGSELGHELREEISTLVGENCLQSWQSWSGSYPQGW